MDKLMIEGNRQKACSVFSFLLVLTFFTLFFLPTVSAAWGFGIGKIFHFGLGDEPTPTTTSYFNNNTYTNTTINDYNDTLWNKTGDKIYPYVLNRSVGIGTDRPAYLFEVRANNSINTYSAISSGEGNGNATLIFREADALRYAQFYDGRSSIFGIFSYAIDKIVMKWTTNGYATITTNLTVDDSVWANNLCYKNGSNCNVTVGSTYNSSYVPYTGATQSVTLGNNNLSLNGSIEFKERGGIQDLFFVNPFDMDGFRMEYWYNFEQVNDDWLIFRKTDGNDDNPDGGIGFMMTNESGYNWTILKLDGYNRANFTTMNIVTTGNITAEWFNGKWNGSVDYVPYTGATGNVNLGNNNLTVNKLNVVGQAWINDTLGRPANMNNLIMHLEEMSTDTLLDKSRSTLSCVGGELNYTLFAIDGVGDWNFNAIIYAGPGTSVANATVTLTCGTDITPVTNYVYWELVGGVPTMTTSSVYPTGTHIDTATFIVGACAGTSYTIYSYSRNRYEVDSFIKRVIQRFEESGTLYVDGFNPAVNTTELNVSSGGVFFNGIFEMTSTNNVKLSEGFYFINSTGNFKQATSLSIFTQYHDGAPFSGGPNERVNVVWGVVPINTTGEVGPTQMRLVAVVAEEPRIKYNTIAEAQSDIYGTINYYPPDAEVKNVFIPIARTIFRPSTDTFEPFSTGAYYQDLRGRITGGGGSSGTTGNTYWTLSGNTLSTISGNYTVQVSNLLINNTNGLFNALSAQGNLNSYFQFNIKNINNGSYASSDIVATSNNGDETNYYIDMGINSANYSDPAYSIMGKNDGYLYVQNGSLTIGTATVNKIIKFFVGGTTTSNEVMNITSTGAGIKNNLVVVGNTTANYFVGNGSYLTDIVATSSSSYNATYNGIIGNQTYVGYFNETTIDYWTTATGGAYNQTILSMPLAANINYTIRCVIFTNGSIATVGTQLNVSLSVAPTYWVIGFENSISPTTSTSLGCSGVTRTCVTNPTDGLTTVYPIEINTRILNGASENSMVVRMRSETGGLVAAIRGSYCKASLEYNQ